MDKRREPRFKADQPVAVTVLSEPEMRLEGRVVDASGRGLGLVTPIPLPPGAAIRIEMDDSMVLGESIYCRSDGDGHFTGVELDQVLVGLTELSRNLTALSEEMAIHR